MYTIISLLNGKYKCVGRLQDSTEYWERNSREEAIESMISFAKYGNGTNINVKFITFLSEKPTPAITIDNDTAKFLDKIYDGHFTVLPFDHYLLKYDLTKEECEIIQKIREGDLKVVAKDSKMASKALPNPTQASDSLISYCTDNTNVDNSRSEFGVYFGWFKKFKKKFKDAE